ncbi:hypothetical protein ACSV5M_12175 [Cellvibrio sp. ARAG 10.3]|uniref:hypothetical protein n=1 Tax=Cellvibrio sp. ARAG 10.3 TaxID=3451358 RepID=UPI003F47A003
MCIKRLIILLSLFIGSLAQADLLVIVHKDNSLERLERKQVVDLFMGRVTAFPNGQSAQTLDFRAGTPLRARFYKALTGKSEAQVDAYWATLIFAGRMSPPKQYGDDQAIIQAVAENPAAIAYVPRQALPSTVKVVMELSQPE